MSINTDKLIPGECYFIKCNPMADWEIMRYGDDRCANPTFYDTYTAMLTPEELDSVFCDTEGNPIPIKRPE